MKKNKSFLLILLMLFFAAPVMADTPLIYFNNQQIGTAIQIDGNKYYIAPDVLGRALKIPIVIGDQSGNVRVDKILLEKLAIRIPSGWLVPVEDIVEAVGYKYIYDRAKGTINIFTGNVKVENEIPNAPDNRSKTETAKVGKVVALDATGRNRQINSGAEGELINIEQHLVKGKTNIVEFYSDY